MLNYFTRIKCIIFIITGILLLSFYYSCSKDDIIIEPPPSGNGGLTDFPVVSSSIVSSYKTIGNKIYFFGGYITGTDPYQCYDKVRVYDLQNNTWSQLSFTLPYGIYDNVSASYYNNHFYLAPGFATGNTNGWGSHKKMIDVNLGTNTAVETHSFPMSKIWNIGNCEVNGKIYFFGGWTGSAESEIYEYNPQTNSLSQVANMNVASNMVSVVVANNGWIYYFGRLFSKFERFNLTTHVVETMTATVPFSQGYIHCWYISNENSIYFFNSGLNKDIYQYDYVNDVIVNTGTTLNDDFVNIPAVKDANDPYSIYALKLNPDYNHPLRLCKLTIGTLNFSVSSNITPNVFVLQQNYPNSFNPSTTIKIDFPKTLTKN